MELMAPSFGLIFWTVVAVVAFIFMIYAVYRLANNESVSYKGKFFWLAVIILFPFFGAIIYFARRKQRNANLVSWLGKVHRLLQTS